jgi:hypothetical protein
MSALAMLPPSILDLNGDLGAVPLSMGTFPDHQLEPWDRRLVISQLKWDMKNPMVTLW